MSSMPFTEPYRPYVILPPPCCAFCAVAVEKKRKYPKRLMNKNVLNVHSFNALMAFAACACLVGAAIVDAQPLENRSAVIWCATDCVALASQILELSSNVSDSRGDLYVSVLPIAGNHTRLRPNPYVSLRPRVHALAEFSYDTWSSLRKSRNLTWTEVACLFYDEMAASNYDVQLGDTWEVDEAPLETAANAQVRAELADALTALANMNQCRLSGVPTPQLQQALPVLGVLLLASVGQSLTYVGPYKRHLKGFLSDANFFRKMESSVFAFSVETYTSQLSTCVDSATSQTQFDAVYNYTNHVLMLAEAGLSEATSPTSAAYEYLRHAYAPTLNAVWGSGTSSPTKSCIGYGVTNSSNITQMSDLIRLQLAANMRASRAAIDSQLSFFTFGFGAICEFAHEQRELETPFAWLLAGNTSTYGPCSVVGATLGDQWGSFAVWGD